MGLGLHFIYSHDEVIVDLLAHGRVKLVGRMRPNKVPDPGRRSLQRAICPTPDEVQVARDLLQFRFTEVKRGDVVLDQTYQSWERVTLPKAKKSSRQS